MSGPNKSTRTGDGVSLSSTFLEFCSKVRNSDPSILSGVGQPVKIRHLSEKEDMELADALLENTNVTYLELKPEKYTKSSAEAMAKYVRTSKRLQHIRIRQNGELREREKTCCFLDAIKKGLLHIRRNGELREREEILCCFLHAIQK
jgi:hypothetical protein